MLADHRDRVEAGNSDLVAIDDGNSRQILVHVSIL